MVDTTTAARSESTKPLYRGVQIVWYILGILEALLAFRFFLKLSGANPDATFTRLIYDITYPFAQPFISVFRVTVVQGKIFEWTTLLAIVVYWLIALAIVRLFVMSRTVSTPEAAVRLQRQDS
jgi:ABC-type Na+ efflux pump permease subunit